jgi:hypothetical protein
MMWLLIAGCFLSDAEVVASRIPIEGGCWEVTAWVGDGWYWWPYGASSTRGCEEGGGGPLFYADGYCWEVARGCGDEWREDPAIELAGDNWARCEELYSSAGTCR